MVTRYQIPLQLTSDIAKYGFVNTAETQLSFDGTNLFTLSATGTTWSYYRAGVRCTVTGNKTVTLPGSPVSTGKYYIFIDDTVGTLQSSTSAWTLNDTKVPVATIYFNNTLTPKFIMSNERHTCLIDRREHMREHYTTGTLYSSGGALSGYTLNTATDAGNTFGISAANIFDEDLYLTLSALTDPNGASTAYQILYRTGTTTWAWKLSDMPFYYTGTSAPYSALYYDNAGTITAVSNKYANYYVVMTNTVLSGEATQGTSTCPFRFSIVPGRVNTNSLTTATGENFASFDLTGFPVDEGVAVWKITFDTSGIANTVKGKCMINSISRVNSNIVQSSSTTTTNHNSLSGLDGGEIGYYGHMTSAQATVLANTSGTNTGDQDLSGLLPKSGGTMTGNILLGENANLELDAALSADGKYTGIVEDGVLGETLSFGQLVYLKAADSRWWKTDANADSTSGAVKLAMVVQAGNAGDTKKVLLYGKIRADAQFPTFTISAPVYIGETAGEVVVTQPTTADVIIRKVGFGNTADELFFCPSTDYIVHV